MIASMHKEDVDVVIELTKNGKPRKRRPKKPIIYFTEDTQKAILRYREETDQAERDRIFNEKIYYAFYKLAENIIHTFKFYYTEVDDIDELKHEVIVFLLEKLHLYDETKGRAYSYFGTIAKRYLITYNNTNYKKLKSKAEVQEVDDDKTITNKLITAYNNSTSSEVFLTNYIKYVDDNLLDIFPKTQEAKVGDAIVELLKRRENLEIFNKKALFIYIKEMTDAPTPVITKVNKTLKVIYKQMLNEYLTNGSVDDVF